MSDDRIIEIVKKFKHDYPMKDWDGDSQEFFESVDETDIIIFFEKLYGVRS